MGQIVSGRYLDVSCHDNYKYVMLQNKDDTVAKTTEHPPPVAPYPPGVIVKRNKTATIQGDIQLKVCTVVVLYLIPLSLVVGRLCLIKLPKLLTCILSSECVPSIKASS